MNINKKFAIRAAAALSMGTLLATTACTDYAQEFKDDADNKIYAEADPVSSEGEVNSSSSNGSSDDGSNGSSDGFIANNYSFDIPAYQVDRSKFGMLWYGYDGTTFQTQAGAGVYTLEKCSYFVFVGRDSLGVDFETSVEPRGDHSMPELISLLRRSGGIAGKVLPLDGCSVGATTDNAKIVFVLPENMDLSDTTTYNSLAFGFQYEDETKFAVSLATVEFNDDSSFVLKDEHKTFWTLDADEGEEKFVTAGVMFEDFVKEYDESTLKKINAVVFEFDYATLNLGSSNFFNIVFVALQHAEKGSLNVDSRSWSSRAEYPICESTQECKAAREVSGCECSVSESGVFKVSGCNAYDDLVSYRWDGPVSAYRDPFYGLIPDSANIMAAGVTDYSTLDPVSVTAYNYFGDSMQVVCPMPKNSGSSSSSSAKSSSSVNWVKNGKFHWISEDGYRVDTGFGENAGFWYYAFDSDYGGKSSIVWPVAIGNDYSETAFDPVIDNCGGVCGSYTLDKGTMNFNPFVLVGFDVEVGETFKAAASDVTEWGGLCIKYTSDTGARLELRGTATVNEEMGEDYPLVTLVKTTIPVVKDFSWDSFKQEGWGKVKISGPEMAKQLASVVFKIQAASGSTGSFSILEIGASGTCAQ